MFFYMLLGFYLLPCIYTYFRLSHFFAKKKHKILFTMFYLILVLAFPFAEVISHRNDPGWMGYLIRPGYYVLPFLLYLFLLVLLFDLLRGLNRLLKIVPVEILKKKHFQFISFWVIVFLAFSIVLFGVINLNTIKVAEYNISIPKGSAHIKQLKIAMASDFHLGQITSKHFLDNFTVKINDLDPDILLIPGDIVEGHGNDGDIEEFARHFRSIKTKYGIFASPGNHEYHGGNNNGDFFKSAGIQLLEDQYILIDDSFCVVGRNDRRSYKRKPLTAILKKLPPQFPVIILDHRPIQLEQVSKEKVDIQLSGHTHYGQLFPINFIIKGIYELAWGYKKIRDSHFFVTSGIQVWGPPVRTAGNSEIMLINVKFK